MAELRTAIDSVRESPIPQESVEKCLLAAEGLQMTRAAWKRGSINALICLMVLYPLGFVFAFGLALYFQTGMIVGTVMAFATLAMISFVALAIKRFVDGTSAGAVLLDCGPHPARKMFRIQAILFVLLGVILLAAQQGWLMNLFAVFAISFSVYWIALSRGRLIICENGIWQYTSLLPWHKIQKYGFVGDDDATLMIQSYAISPMFGRGALPIHVNQKEEIAELLRARITDVGSSPLRSARPDS